MFRVKVYELDSESNWVDKGTGTVSVEWVDAKEANCIIIKPEDPSIEGLLMNSSVRQEFNTYSRQQDTLIVWTEPYGTDLALSFQDINGCNEIWAAILEAQKRMRADKHDIDQLPLSTDAFLTDDIKTDWNIMDPELSNLSDVSRFLEDGSKSIHGRNKIIDYIIKSDFLDKLIKVFNDCEDLENLGDLYIIGDIMRMIILLNDTALYELILRDDKFQGVLGMLEYDKEYPHIKADYREHLSQKSNFKQIIAFNSPEVIFKIIQTYRVQFLKDVALARILDEHTFSSLSSIAFFNQTEIIAYIQNDQSFQAHIFAILSEDNLSAQKRKDVIMFLHELSVTVKSLHIQSKLEFFRSLASHGLFAIFEYTIGDKDIEIRIAIIALLANILENESALVRSFCLAQSKQNQKTLIETVIERLIEEPDSGLRSQLSEIIRMIIDTARIDAVSDGIVQHTTEAEDFLQLFYDSYVTQLAQPIMELDESMIVSRKDGTKIVEMDASLVDICFLDCELFSFMVKSHQFRSKFFFMGGIIKKLLLLLLSRETFLRIAALRLFRTLVGTKEEFYTRILLKNDVLNHVFDFFLGTKNHNNLMNSACLEFFEFIRKENIRPLISNIIANRKKELDSLNYSEVFSGLILKHEQNNDNCSDPQTDSAVQNIARVPMVQRSGWDVEKEEESYFNDVDETSNQAQETQPEPVIPTMKKLVDYPDDEEENLVLRTKSKPKLAINLKKERPPEAPLEFVRSSLDEIPHSDHTLKKRKSSRVLWIIISVVFIRRQYPRMESINKYVEESKFITYNESPSIWNDSKTRLILDSSVLDRKGLTKLIKKGVPDNKRAFVYAKLLEVESGLHEFEKNYLQSQKRTHGAVIPENPVPPTFGGRISYEGSLALKPEGIIIRDHILCILANDFPNLSFAPCLPAICFLLAHIAKDENQLLGLLVAIIKINYGGKTDTSSLYSNNSAYSPKETRNHSFYFAHTIKDSKLLSRAFGNLLYKKNRKLHSHLKNLHSTLPKPVWDKWFSDFFINIIPQQALWKLLDGFICTGHMFMFQFSLALLCYFQKSLLKISTISEFDDFFHYQSQAFSDPSVLLAVFNEAEKVSVKIITTKLAEHHPSLSKFSSEDIQLVTKRQRGLPKFISSLINNRVKSSQESLSSENKVDLLSASTVLQSDYWIAMWSWIPSSKQMDSIQLIFTTREHGTHISTLYRLTQDISPMILIIETTKGNIFGAYLSQPWKHMDGQYDGQYYGNGESFLFTLAPYAKLYPWVGRFDVESEDAQNSDNVTSYKTNLFVQSGTDFLNIGAGGGKVGLHLDEMLSNGETSHCFTFGNEPLTGDKSTSFTIFTVEVFAFV